MFIDSLETRIDDVLIDALVLMYSQIPFANSEGPKNDEAKIYDFRQLEIKMDEKIKVAPASNKRIYIKFNENNMVL